MAERPSVGRIVHYVSYGTPAGEYTQQCRAATVTEVDGAESGYVGLAVLNPSGLFFHSLDEGGCLLDAGGPAPGGAKTEACDGKSHGGGTWHWPART